MTLEKWQKLSFFEQMGNIGSEVSRAGHWIEKGDKENQKKSLERAIVLIDLSIQSQGRSSRLFELLRLREVICDIFIGGRNYNVHPRNLENYFLPFALAARK